MNWNIINAAALILLLISCTNQTNDTVKTKEIASFVLDDEDILSSQQRISLDSLFRAHEKKTTNEVVVLTTADFGEYSTIEEFSSVTGNELGVGKAGKDNGVLIVFSKSQRQTRIELGYGTEEVFSDLYAKAIIDSLMIPKFREEHYFDGLCAAGVAIVEHLEKPENVIRSRKE